MAWTLTAVCANATVIVAKVSSQKAEVRRACASVNETSSAGGGGAPAGRGASSGGAPSGRRPKSSGRRRMKSQPGTTISRKVNTASAA